MPYVATVLGNPSVRILSPELAEMARAAVDGTKITWLSENNACDIELPLDADKQQAHLTLRQTLSDAPLDIVVQETNTRHKQALIADMDSTMIEQECIDELAAEIGVKDTVAAITARAMNGEIDFEDAVDERVALLKGLRSDIADEVISNRITYASGGHTLVSTMKARGAYTALVSGGFTTFTQPIGSELGFDENRANVLEEEDGKLTGTVRKPILGAEAKVSAMMDIAKSHSLETNDFIAVGDGANDLPMLKLAGTGVALHAKPNVAAQAEVVINHGDLTALLYLQGYTESTFANV